MIRRLYVEKKPGLALEAEALKNDIGGLLRLPGVTDVRVLNRYDVENIGEELFSACRSTVFAEPQVDRVFDALPDGDAAAVFAVEYLPGQFDQRADSAAQCIQILSQGERPAVRTARVILIYGKVSSEELEKIKKYVINPVESREASLDMPRTLGMEYEMPAAVETLDDFTELSEAGMEALIRERGLAMDLDDLRLCRQYFRDEGRNPTLTELRVLDTYWSDHCRHTTFLTSLDSVRFESSVMEKTYKNYLAVRKALGVRKPVCLMDLATLAARHLKANGELPRLDESEEVNACTVKIDVEVQGRREPWLLLFKNETHNHPTEIEPFGGAATCIGGAIRDPLSGRAYVYAAMRLTGASDPTAPFESTLPGKLPQRKLTTTAAAGYSSYGNQIGLATGLVDELYHPGFVAKRMEIGAVVGAVPAPRVRREKPVDGDLVLLLGGRTGRDGCGGATGSSKAHDISSLASCGAEVQKGNAPEERKLQRLFRNPEAAALIKRCNDFGAGGVSVAIGELADGLEIYLDNVPKKYEGLDGTELAISESQERMAVVVEQEQAEKFLELAAAENLEATVVARVTARPHLVMHWNGEIVVDIKRAFLDTHGAEKHAEAAPAVPLPFQKEVGGDFKAAYKALCADLNVCSKRGLSERFDSTIGAGTVLMPFGGKYQQTPVQAMAHKVSDETRETDTCSLMAWGCNPYIAGKSPYHAAHLAVVESVSKLAAAGAGLRDVYLSFQEFFGKPRNEPVRWGQPLAALLGAFRAQMELGIAAVGGKDSMSGSFEDLDVPPTLVSFAVTTEKAERILSPEFKEAGHRVVLLPPEYGKDGLPTPSSLQRNFEILRKAVRAGEAVAVYTPGFGGVAEAVFKMCLGNGLGFAFDPACTMEELFGYRYGAFVLELSGGFEVSGSLPLGTVAQERELRYRGAAVSMDELQRCYEDRLEPVFPSRAGGEASAIPAFSYRAASAAAPIVKTAKPRVLIPVFPGTNCEYDTAKAFAMAGAEPEIFVVRNLGAEDIARSVEGFAAKLRQAQMVFIPGGFSAGDEPDGSGKFITAFFRSAAVREETTALLDARGGLMAGVCNGFQALIKLGLVPYGRITDTEETDPTLTYNTIGRHQSRIVRVRVVSHLSPWLAGTEPGEVYTVPISHGEGRFLADEKTVLALAEKGQIATQYADLEGAPTSDILYNPNGSVFAVEGITSPDGRVLGKMGHAERTGKGLYINVPGNYDMKLFSSAVAYFR